MELTIRKSAGLDDVLNRVKPQAVEERKPLTQQNNQLSEAFSNYLQILYTADISDDFGFAAILQKFYSRSPLLTPLEVNQFLQLVDLSKNERYYQYLTGLYVTTLLQKSYDSGHNDFSLNLHQLDYLGMGLSGKGNRIIKLGCSGNLGDWNFEGARYLHLKLACSELGPRFAESSENCYFNLGKEKIEFGSLFSANPFRRTRDCLIITSNLSSYTSLKNICTFVSGKNNFLILTNAVGKELERYRF